MSRKTDEFKVLATTTELIGKHMDFKSLEHKGTAEIEQALIKAFKIAESSLLAHIKQEIQQINDIDSLTRVFRSSCYGLGALGLRHDLIKRKLVGKKQTGTEALREAIEEDVEDEGSFPQWGVCCGDSKSFNLSNEAFESGSFGVSETDKRALVALVILDFVLTKGYKGLKIASVIADMEYSCAKHLLEGATKDRTIIGYYEGYEYILEGVNKEFILLFAGTLKKLLSQTESVQVLEMKQYLQEQVIMAWTGCCITKPMEVYIEIENLISTNRTSQEVAPEELIHSRDFAVKSYGSNGVTFELSRDGLKSFVDLLESLELGVLQEVSLIIGKIKETIAI